MDNLSHTLIGLIAGESLARSLPPSACGLEPQARRNLFVVVAAVGGNLPDLDLLYSWRSAAGLKLGYLLQHRGYTHTVLVALGLGMLLYAAAVAWLRWKERRLSPADHAALLGVAVFGTVLHLLMDGLNSYGIHPFWPFRNEWLYGDAVFIVEPLYWIAAAPLLFTLRTRLARGVLGACVAGALIAALVSGLVPWSVNAAMAVLTVFLVWIGSRVGARSASLWSAAAFCGITAAFVIGGRCAAQRIEAQSRSDFPGEHLLDHVLTPLPANPVCWDAVTLQTQGEDYIARHELLSLAPSILPVSNCAAALLERPTTAPYSALRNAASAELRWREFRMLRADLASLVTRSCDAAAFMHFARAPYVLRQEPAWIVGDLRFDHEAGKGFAELEIQPAATAAVCTAGAPWTPPRLDLLR